MDLAVLSDIHGNYIALSRCVGYALDQGITTFLFLGDYLGELAYPENTMKMIYQMKEQYQCYFIKGNKEDYWLNHRAGGGQGWKECDSTTGSLLYTYSHLTHKDFVFYESLPMKRELTFPDMPPMTVCHGSPEKINENMFSDRKETYEIIEREKNLLLLCGHTHVQDKIEYKGKTALNPGSVGVPLFSGGKSQFMILHEMEKKWKEEFISLSYDVERVIYELHECGLDVKAPCWCKVTEHLLRNGSICHAQVLSRAMELCKEEKGFCNWPDIPEKCWEKAVKELL